MAIKIGTKKIKGNEVDLVLRETLQKFIRPRYKYGGLVIFPTRFAGMNARIEIISPEPFVCLDCCEVFDKEKYFSKTKDLCLECYDLRAKIKKGPLSCRECKTKITEDQIKLHWGRFICEECVDKERQAKLKEIEK